MLEKKTVNNQEPTWHITDAMWNRIKPFLVNCRAVKGDPEKCRLYLSAVLWIAKENTKWNALPDEYGNWNSIYNRFRRWCDAGVFELLQTYFQADEEISNVLNTLYVSPVYAKTLKTRVKNSLKNQGFKVQDDQISLPENLDKGKIRELHTEAVRHKIEECKKGLIEHEPSLLQCFASGEEIVPDKIKPELVEVHAGSKEALLFRYAGLHWSIPVSSGYGRRLRYLVMDEHTNKLMGLFGLGDPVFSLRHRDQWVGWNHEDRKERLRHVVDAFVLGAVPPYSFLLAGKLIALLATSNEVREAFKHKYEGKKSVIRERKNTGEIAMVTTTSALGRSSMYNLLKCAEPKLSAQPNIEIERLEKRLVFECVGHTQGFGEFHFSNGIYGSLTAYAKSNATATASHESWGSGFRNRQEVVQKALGELGLPKSWLNHGIRREIYVAPLAENTRAFLCGDDLKLNYYDQPISELFQWYCEKWLLPRSKQNETYKHWNPKELELWGDTPIKPRPVKQTNDEDNETEPEQVDSESEKDLERASLSNIVEEFKHEFKDLGEQKDRFRSDLLNNHWLEHYSWEGLDTKAFMESYGVDAETLVAIQREIAAENPELEDMDALWDAFNKRLPKWKAKYAESGYKENSLIQDATEAELFDAYRSYKHSDRTGPVTTEEIKDLTRLMKNQSCPYARHLRNMLRDKPKDDEIEVSPLVSTVCWTRDPDSNGAAGEPSDMVMFDSEVRGGGEDGRNVSLSHQKKNKACPLKSKQNPTQKQDAAVNGENEYERLIAKAIDRRQKLENAFENHELSDYLTYEKFIDVCISERKVSTTAWRACAISPEAIRGYSNHLRVIRIAIAAFETLSKGINYGDNGAAWVCKLLVELKSETAAKLATKRDSRKREK